MTNHVLPLAVAVVGVACSQPSWPESTRAADTPVHVFRLNSFTKGDQRWPEIAIADDGRAIVAGWASFGQNGNRWSVVAQRFDASGARVGGEFDVDDFRGDERPNAEDPSIDFDGQGNFVVAWHSHGTDEADGGWTIWQRRYRADGTPSGPGVRVPTDTACDQWRPTAMSAADGTVMVTWYTDVPPCGGEPTSEIRGRMSDAAGRLGRAEIRISGASRVRLMQWRQGACNRAGEFVSLWYVEKPKLTCYARAFDAAGRPLGDVRPFDAWVNAGVRADGHWFATAGGTGRWHRADGTPTGPPIPISGGEVAMNDSGAFVTIALTTGGAGPGLYAYTYDADGKSAGAPIFLSPGHPQPAGPPHVDMSETGVIVATWEAAGDGDGAAVWGAIAQHPQATRAR